MGLTVIIFLIGVISFLIIGKYSDSVNTFILLVVSLGITLLLTSYIEKNAYRIKQKDYGVVTVSNKWSHSQDLEDDEDEFSKIEDALFATGKVSSTFMYNLAEWNEKQGVVTITQDPTFLVISDNGNANIKMAMKNPFMTTSNLDEVLRFLK
ncbi:hypothetical protein HHO41_14890 [Bacillus sp. DNRA2]|uniref:hypothetical protein n=1 Tax=Bacillus sp. DNRA2 TaxID=2723053 RepID=UPI00145E30C4|nr:hypothetical protein [Bacillus sp. DNRA2]NMD71587.1 hypothetical protein [Bacillus sp. DNRA2]